MGDRATLDDIDHRRGLALMAKGDAIARHDWAGVVLLQAWIDHLRRQWDVELARRPRSCNRHTDCDAAELRITAGGGEVPAGFHCHDDDCPDCFGY